MGSWGRDFWTSIWGFFKFRGKFRGCQRRSKVRWNVVKSKCDIMSLRWRHFWTLLASKFRNKIRKRIIEVGLMNGIKFTKSNEGFKIIQETFQSFSTTKSLNLAITFDPKHLVSSFWRMPFPPPFYIIFLYQFQPTTAF